MSRTITLSHRDLLQQAKYRYQIPQLIAAARQHHVLLSTAETKGIIVSADDLQQSADRLRVQHNLLGAKDTLSWLEHYHFSIEDFENLAYIKLLRSRLSEMMFDDQVAMHFADRQLEYIRSTIYEILLIKHELAMELYDSLKERETDFLAVLHEYSSRPKARSVRRRDLPPELSAIVFTADPPTLLRPIRTPAGTHLIYVAARDQTELTASLRSQIREELFDRWLVEQSELFEVMLPEDLITE
jgi:parvulin-like peptidyl-prolyl isomerase